MTIDTTSYAIPVARSVASLRAIIADWRKQGLKVGLVPTMGALHSGHLSLVDLARTKVDRVIVSIFVNPTQFAPNEDFGAYPRTEAADAEKLAGHGHLIFAPAAEEMYHPGFSTTVSVAGVSAPLEGQFRRRISRASPPSFPNSSFRPCPTLLASRKGLAAARRHPPHGRRPRHSGRNSWRRNPSRSGWPRHVVAQRLSLGKRAEVGGPVERGPARGGGEGRERCRHRRCDAGSVDRIRALGFDHVDYLEVRDAASLEIFPSGHPTAPARILVAAKIGRTRLIDNMPV